MNTEQAQTLQDLCQKHNAIGCEVWFVGIRFYLASGKMSKIYSRKDLGLETGQVWINLINFKLNERKFLFKIHPDQCCDKVWAELLFKNYQTDLLFERLSSYQLREQRVVPCKPTTSNEVGQEVNNPGWGVSTSAYDFARRKSRGTQRF